MPESGTSRVVRTGTGAGLGERIAEFADRLACPSCRSPIAGPDGLACPVCSRRFSVRAGVPILLPDATSLPVDLDERAEARAASWKRRWRNRIAYPVLVNTTFQRRAVQRFLESFDSADLVLDVGTSLRDPDPRAIRLDIVFSPNLDLVGDGEALPFLDDSVDGVLCTGVLEHVAHPERIVAEIGRVLRPGGRLYAAAPFIQGYHPAPTDYRRYTREGMAQLFESFIIESLRNTRGSGSAAAWILAAFLTELLSFNRPWLYRLVGVPVRWLCMPLKYLDFLLVHGRYDHYVTSGFTVEARKPVDSDPPAAAR